MNVCWVWALVRHSYTLSGFFIYTWPPILAPLLAQVLTSPSKEPNSRNMKKKVSRRTKHTCQREFMRTIISMSGSRCQQYFLLSRCLDGVLVWREATSCLWGEERTVRSPWRSLTFRINTPAAKLLLCYELAPSHIFKWGGANEEEKKSFPQQTDALIVPDNRRKSGPDSVCLTRQVLPSSHYILYIFHFGPSCVLHRSAWIYSRSEPPSSRGAARRDAEAHLLLHHLFHRQQL